MMRSLYSGVAGLKNHQTRMDVIGNNIANVNSNGFKSSRVVFQDVYSQTSKSASAPNGTVVGGTNPMQIGLGVNLAAIDIIHSNAAPQMTGGELDLAISGDGFFIVNTPTGEHQYTRLGNLYVDESGNLLNSTGNFIQGLQDVTTYLVKKGTPAIPANGSNQAIPATDPEFVYVTGTDGDKTDLDTVMLLNPYELDPVADATEYEKYFDKTTGELLPEYQIVTGINPKLYQQVDNTKGLIYTNMGDSLLPDAVEKGLGNLNLSGYYKISIDESGVIRGMNNEGRMCDIGVIALATFSNPGGLEKQGSSLYAASANTGDPIIGQANTVGIGSISPGALEMSNVDLANEFTDMIITQRGFQANSRIITTSDSLLEELVNLKR